MRTLHQHLLAGLLLASSAALAPAQSVLINEIMYHPASENLRESYVELFNPGAAAVDLTGWQFTKGITFAFPSAVSLAPGGYLVVAADAFSFTNKYPGVTNLVAGWPGAMGKHLRLENAAGQVVNEVKYSNDGDWAARILTTNGFASYGHYGWEWQAAHDGLGSSLELMNPTLPNAYGQNWGSSAVPNGTPGQANSIARTNIAPIITAVNHAPVIPQPTDVVTVSARLVDERATGLSLTLFYRDASTTNPPAFTGVPMLDDGAHNDALAGDGIYAAILPARPDGTVIEFYLQAQDPEGNLRVYPNVIPPASSSRTANLLYQVDDGVYTGSQPLYRLIMTEMERLELYQLGRGCPGSSPGASMDSDAQMNATWVTIDGDSSSGTTTRLNYSAGVRNRGHGTRSSNPNNYHVNFPGDHPWKNVTGINLNSQFAFSQVLGSAVFRRAGVPMAQSRAVQLRVNGTNLMSLAGLPNLNSYGSYAANEQYNNDFIQRAFALDPYGNSYRGIRDQSLCDTSHNSVADLSWQGASYAVPAYTNAYFKQNNFLENDWSDLLDLIAVLNSANGYQPANYATDVQRRVNVDEWMKYMALNTLLDNDETCLANGFGDDYALFRGTNDTRFLALPYDLDSVMGRGLTPVPPRHSIFRMTALPAMNRFMKTPEFAPRYYYWLKALADTTFAPAQMNPLLDQLFTGYLPPAVVDTMKAFNAAQVGWVASRIPLTLTVSNSLATLNGYPRSTTPTITLFGTADAINTRAVLVNGAPAAWTAWQGAWTNTSVNLFPGLNRLLIQSLDANGVEFDRTYADVWYDNGPGQAVGDTITVDTTWTAAAGPYNVTNTLTVASGATLTIQPGTTLYLGSGVNLVVANGGRLLAEGTLDAPIRFSVAPGSGVNWGGMTINGANGSPETRIAYAFFEGNSTICIEVSGGTLYLDHSSFGTTTHQYLSLDNSSFLLSSCYFPSSTSPFELLHGTGGIKAGGHGVVRDCFFGTTSGYNDIMDFTGGNRDLGQPIIQFLNNVFAGASDDILDLDGTDAWIEGNIFLHTHRNGSPDSSSAVSGGSYDFGGATGVRTSEITVIGNLFFDCDDAATAKEGDFFTLLNNTIIRITKTGGEDFGSGVVNVRDTTPALTTFGLGFYLEGNIIRDVEQLVRNYDSTQTTVTFNNNILPVAWSGPGTNNLVADPLLIHVPELAETWFTNWDDAQILRRWFALRPGSPAIATGPNGRDIGGVIPLGASIAGEPPATNNQTTATLTVGPVRSGFAIPTAGWPAGSGYTHYQWRLDAGNWSAETPATAPILLTGLANGSHQVQVIGKRDSGWYQNDPAFGPDSLVTTSRTWVVDTAFVPPTTPTVRLNEILALNTSTLTNAGTTPDLLELFNYGAAPVALAGLGLSDDPTLPYRFSFPANTSPLGPGQYLVLYADSQTSAPGTHLGFGLKGTGDALYLHDSPAAGSALLDSVVFGMQIPDLSIGRAGGGAWVLCRPTFGTNNLALPFGDPHALRINEWLADELFLANNDFIELFNPGSLPVALGGCFLSDAEGAPALSPVPPLTFVAAGGYASFVADGTPAKGADHLNFKLDPNVGVIILSDPELWPIDIINYGPQTTDVAQGRSPSGSDTLVSFLQPTPGGPNPAPNGGTTSVTNITTSLVPLLGISSTWKYDNSGGTNFGTSWYQTAFEDTAWTNGTGLFGSESTPAEYPFPFTTFIPAPNQPGGHIAVFYRTHFQWDGSLTNVMLASTNYIDDGSVYYLNGFRCGAIRMPASVVYNTVSSGQPPTEGLPDFLFLAATNLLVGDNLLAVEVHQINDTSSDDVFGMQLNAVQFTTNIITTIATGVPVVLNEILARNQSLTNAAGATPDWVELYNTSSNTLDLAGLSLSDDPNSPRKFVFAPGAQIEPHGFLLLTCDPNSPASPANTGFGLNASGGSLFLFNRQTNGGGLVDAITFGLQVADLSIGRIPNGSGDWTLNVPTLAAPNTAAGLGAVAGLSLNEWMADPATGSDWFELYNRGSLPVSLGGLFFTDDLASKTLSPIPPLSFIGAGGFLKFLADGNPNAGADHVKFSLSKTGEALGLYSTVGLLIDGLTFGPQPTAVSQGRFPDGSTNIVSFSTTASPAESNFLPLPNVVVNEVLTHTDPPLEDALELFNSGVTPVELGGWFISNSQDNLKKFRIADGTVLPGGGFKVFYESQFNPVNGSSIPFTFNSAHGDRAFLSEADAAGNLTGYRAAAAFGAAANGVSFGRYTNSIGAVDFVGLTARTFGKDNPLTLAQFETGTGAPNASPRVGPIVINEIMSYPPPNGVEDDTQSEFIELLNITPYDVPLFDPAFPANTWKIGDGIDYTFPAGVTVPAEGSLLLVNFAPGADQAALAAFLARYQPTAPLFGPYSGHLANAGESLQLFRPDIPQAPPHPDAGFVPYILVDRVDYLNSAPWPAGAAGTGASLQRLKSSLYGNDPGNWFAAAPTAGRANTADPLDANADGLPDAWQIQYFGSLANPDGAPAADPDHDGFNNLQEYLAGTIPSNPDSRLKLDSVVVAGGATTIHFTAVAQKTYSILYKPAVNSPFWFILTNVPAQAVSGPIAITDPAGVANDARMYRLVTPRLP